MSAYVPQPWSPDKLRERQHAARRVRYEPMLATGLAVMGGIVLDRYASMGLWWLAPAMLAWLTWFLLWRCGRDRLAAVTLLLAVVMLAGAWHHVRWRLFPTDDLGFFSQTVAQPIALDAIALESPAVRPKPEFTPYRAIPGDIASQLELRVIRLRDGVNWRNAAGKTRLTCVGPLTGVKAGDTVRVYGQVYKPTGALNPGEFDSAEDARAGGSLTRVRCEAPACVAVRQNVQAPTLWRPLDNVKRWGERRLIERLGAERGALAAAMIVGARDGLTRATVDRYRRAGALHVLVVSGLHVGLVVGAFFVVARMGWSPRRGALVVIMIAILAYALMTGARPPVVRAAVLAELMCLALWQGRQVLAMNSLAAAAVVVLALNPCELFRTGAQLSFLAAATLISFGHWRLNARSKIDPMTRLLRSVEPLPLKAIRGAMASSAMIFLASVMVWIVAMPLMSYRLNLLSPIAMPTSVAVFPLVSLTVVSGLVVLLSEATIPALAALPAWVCQLASGSLDWVVERSEAGHLFVPGPPLWFVLTAYLLMLLALLWGARRWVSRSLTYAGLVLVIAGYGLPVLAQLNPPNEQAPLRCTFIAVGHGVSVLIETPRGGAFLYDAGSLGSPWIATDRISSVLWQRGVRRLDGVFLSHADVDHFNGLPGLVDRFKVQGVYTSHQTFPRRMLEEERSAPAELARLLQRHGIPVHRLALGDRVDLGGATADVLFPTLAGVIDSDNANSLVLGIEAGGHRILLPGDLEGRGLEELLLQEPYQATVLLAPHHGSPRSDPPGFAAWSSPEHVVVSAAAGVYSGAANLSYQASGAKVYSTASSGAVAFTFEDKKVRVETFRSPN